MQGEIYSLIQLLEVVGRQRLNSIVCDLNRLVENLERH